MRFPMRYLFFLRDLGKLIIYKKKKKKKKRRGSKNHVSLYFYVITAHLNFFYQYHNLMNEYGICTWNSISNNT
ncbi:hypothetical protein MtrunA17_Chr3g0107801 [Medicago truncatula]|uniref:Transmembrane protein n=1 Tax=Medicago truncatula TaxID=3880 RepID=A0A396ITU6_MEDTR|nr:hypothetical protein MtrunA17_Chr3g0107801 [Medicago truncatula]